jgi:hypothetical protein
LMSQMMMSGLLRRKVTTCTMIYIYTHMDSGTSIYISNKLPIWGMNSSNKGKNVYLTVWALTRVQRLFSVRMGRFYLASRKKNRFQMRNEVKGREKV